MKYEFKSIDEFMAALKSVCQDEPSTEASGDELIAEVPEGYLIGCEGYYLVMPKTCLVSSSTGKQLWATEHEYYFPSPCPHADVPHGNPEETESYYVVWASEYILPEAVAKNGGGTFVFGEWKTVEADGVKYDAFCISEEPRDGHGVLVSCVYPSEDADLSNQPGLLFSKMVSDDIRDGFLAIYSADESWKMLQQCCQRQYEFDAEEYR